MTHSSLDRIVLHLSGPDRAGLTAKLVRIIAEERGQLVTIGQSVLHGYLTLSAIVDIPPESVALRRILFASSELGYRLEAAPFSEPGSNARSESEPPGLCVTLIGDNLCDGVAVAEITGFLAARHMSIRDIRTLSEHALSGIELTTGFPEATLVGTSALSALRGEILSLARSFGVDVAVQRDDIFRRIKRLVCLDVDSTFAQGEFIDELASLAGCGERVARITERAMHGELDFKQALRERVKLLAGLPFEQAERLVQSVKLTPGALELARTLKALGFQVGLVSGGFDFFVRDLERRYGLDFAFANELEVVEGKLTGVVQGSIVDAERKAQIVKDMCQIYKCRIEQSVAIGDGANDMLMLQTAGLGIAFRGKPKLQAVADMSLNHSARMDVLLFLLGFNSRDLSVLET